MKAKPTVYNPKPTNQNLTDQDNINASDASMLGPPIDYGPGSYQSEQFDNRNNGNYGYGGYNSGAHLIPSNPGNFSWKSLKISNPSDQDSEKESTGFRRSDEQSRPIYKQGELDEKENKKIAHNSIPPHTPSENRESPQKKGPRNRMTRADQVQRTSATHRRIITGAALGKTGQIVFK